MDIYQAIVLSIIEGLTEFLPISSTGHLILSARVLSIPQTDFLKSFEIYIQLGAILAVVVLYFKRYIQNIEVWKKVLMAFLPTAVVGLGFYRFIKDYLLGNPYVSVGALLIGGILLIILEIIYRERSHHVSRIEELSLKQSFLIGLAQSFSIIPGVSRSAATIIGAMFLGTKREAAVEFSFLLAIPTMLAASGLEVFKSNHVFSQNEWIILGVGFGGAFVSAMLVVRWFIKFVKSNNFILFGIYRIVLAIAFWILVLR